MRLTRLGAAAAVAGSVLLGLLAGSLLGSAGSGLVDSGSQRPRPGAAERSLTRAATSPLTTVAWPRGESVVANAAGRRVLAYRRRGDVTPLRAYTNPTPQRTPLVFLARRTVAGWVQAMLPSRPNGSEGWIPAAQLVLRADPYSAVVDLARRRLEVRRGAAVVLRAAVGVGRAATPTPAGLYYVTQLLRQPDPAGTYGPWAFALSAHSTVISHFGGGDGQVGLHGTNEPGGIGRTVSHGCIRVANGVIERLAAMLPLGTPIRIIARARMFTRS